MTSLFRTGSRRARTARPVTVSFVPKSESVREFTPRIVSPTPRVSTSQPNQNTQSSATYRSSGNGNENGNGHKPAVTATPVEVKIISPTLSPAVVERFTIKTPAPSDFQPVEMPALQKSGKPAAQVIANRRNRTYYTQGSDYYRMMTAARPKGDDNWIIFASENEARSAGYAQQ
jgi:hypothetical protein